MKPIIKWAGGKQQLLGKIRERLPKEFNTYYEPFAGGLALLLDLNPTNFTINDINPELINTYLIVRDQVEDLILCLTNLDTEHEAAEDPKAFYYKIRSDFNKNLGIRYPQQAARFIYLNKHCFNGLYRVNSRGEFNVPFNGKLSGRSFDPDQLRELSSRLKNARILNTDFEAAVKGASAGDFVFFDSPYAPLTPTSFTDYTKEGFSLSDHERLAELYKNLSTRGVYCMLTNHNTALIRELYKDYQIETVSVSRSINSKADARKGEEVIITNY